MPEKILVVDDTPANMSVLVDLLEPQGYAVSAAPNGIVGLNVAAKLKPDVILLDVMMPEMDGLETCRRLKANPLTAEVPVLFISARDDAGSMLEGFRAGGADYIAKPFQPDEVLARVQAHLRLAALTQELKARNVELTAANVQLQNEILRRTRSEEALRSADQQLRHIADREARRWGIEQFVGKSETLMKILGTIRRLQNFATVSVLITGESGTGKELVARAVHHGTPPRDGRGKGPFVAINCMAIPEEIAESTFFGHMQGAVPAAVADQKGLFELANGGTLFLDEVGGMPAALQVKLLRVLEDGQITPLGSTTARQVQVRVIAATNADLQEQLAAGTFRRDLYFRLAQFSVHVPPLRERQMDIALLAEHFVRVFSADMGLKPPHLAPEAVAALEGYDFPGNVRELKNMIERALIESGGRNIESFHLAIPDAITSQAVLGELPSAAGSSAMGAPTDDQDLPLNLAKAEALLIERALAQTGGNVARAARLLGINRSRIYRKFHTPR